MLNYFINLILFLLVFSVDIYASKTILPSSESLEDSGLDVF